MKEIYSFWLVDPRWTIFASAWVYQDTIAIAQRTRSPVHCLLSIEEVTSSLVVGRVKV
jgi:hypothetical protein